MDYLPNLPLTITPLVAFGMMLLVGSLGGFLVHRWPWFPSITGFMAVGLLIGPSGLDIITESTLVDARILVDIALALILYRLGLALDIKRILQQPSILLASLAESTATWLLVFTVLRLAGMDWQPALLLAAIAISSSPAVLLHVANEVGAKGPVTGAAKTQVAMNNLLSYLAFSGTLPLLHYSGGADWHLILLQPLYRLAGSLMLGCAVAWLLYAVSTLTRDAPQYRLALVIGSVMISIGLAYELKLSLLFVPLVIGVTVRSLEQKRLISKLDFGPPFELFFIVLFVSAGASLHLSDIVAQGWLLMLFVCSRIMAKLLVITGASRQLGRTYLAGFANSLLLVPMAGLAIGLVQTSGHLFPQHAVVISTLVFGAVAIFETIGPLLATLAFHLAGEAGKSTQDSDPTDDAERM